MTRKRLLLVLMFLVIGVLFAGAWGRVRGWGRPSVTRANFERITVGMTPDEVDGILGKPSWSVQVGSWKAGRWTNFYSDGRTEPIAVEFNNGIVTAKTWEDDDSFVFRILRSWFGL